MLKIKNLIPAILESFGSIYNITPIFRGKRLILAILRA